MLNIGCHLSASKGYKHMGEEALSINANTFQFFSRNPRGSVAKAVNVEDINALIEISENNNFAPLLVHAPYTLNACSADEGLRGFAGRVMTEDLETLELLPGNMYNFHPGSHVGQGEEAGIEFIAKMLSVILQKKHKTKILLETMSGKGSEVGKTFEEIREIMDKTQGGDILGVCLDTCHVFSAGYDIVRNLDGVLNNFDNIIGLEKLNAIHLNDSMTPFNSHKDRHEKIGKGTLDLEAIKRIINHPKLKHIPFFLETPNEIDGYAAEIKLLRDSYID